MENQHVHKADLWTDEERYRVLVEHVSDWIWEVNEHGIYTYASPRIKDILGYSPCEVIGKTPFDLMEPNEAVKIGSVFEYHVVNKLPIKSLENINLHRDGHEVILETSGSPIIDAEGNCIGYRGIDRDITLRKQSERRQQQLLDIIEASPDFIATLDTDGNSLYYNPAARKMLGITEEQTTEGQASKQRWLTDIIKNQGIPIAMKNGHWKGENIIFKNDGSEIPVSQMIVAHKSENGAVDFLSTIAHDITERIELEKVIEYQAYYDALTNLPNRRSLHKKMAKIMNRPSADNKTAILFIDLDNFKEINDQFGHETGDYILKRTAAQLKEAVGEIPFVCRYGGDEFIVILEHTQDEGEIRGEAGRILASIKQPIQLDDHTVQMTGSIGISVYPDDGTDVATLIDQADHAMYKVKRDGKNDYTRMV